MQAPEVGFNVLVSNSPRAYSPPRFVFSGAVAAADNEKGIKSEGKRVETTVQGRALEVYPSRVLALPSHKEMRTPTNAKP